MRHESLTRDDCDGETIRALVMATLSHHWLPLQLEGAGLPNPAIWRGQYGLDPAACARRIGALVS